MTLSWIEYCHRWVQCISDKVCKGTDNVLESGTLMKCGIEPSAQLVINSPLSWLTFQETDKIRQNPQRDLDWLSAKLLGICTCCLMTLMIRHRNLHRRMQPLKLECDLLYRMGAIRGTVRLIPSQLPSYQGRPLIGWSRWSMDCLHKVGVWRMYLDEYVAMLGCNDWWIWTKGSDASIRSRLATLRWSSNHTVNWISLHKQRI
jgi:hypothetical protein